MGDNIVERMIALFIIALIVLFPLSSVGIYATEGDIAGFAVKGNTNNVEGFVAENEKIKYEVIVGSGVPDPDSNLHLRLGIGANWPFDSCVNDDITGGKRCTLVSPSSDTSPIDWLAVDSRFLDTFTINVRLFNTPDDRLNGWDSIAPIDDAAATYTIENTVPSFTNLQITGNTITFAARDDGVAGRCAGLKNIQFYKGSIAPGNLLGESLTSDSCDATGTFAITGNLADDSPANFAQGDNTIVVKLEDRIGHTPVRPRTVTYNLDTVAPAITGDSFKIFKEPLGEITKRSSADRLIDGITVKVEFDDDVETSSVLGIFTSLNPALNNPIPPTPCNSANGNKVICEWRGLSLKLLANPLEIFIQGSDTNGNVIQDATTPGSKKLSLTLDPDSSLKVLSISVNGQPFAAGPRQYARTNGNKINVTFEEETYLLKDGVFISGQRADECKRLDQISEPNKWNCVWNSMRLSGGALTLDSGTTDILGNPISAGENKQVEIVIDDTAPVVNLPADIVITTAITSPTDEPIPGIYKVDDRLNVNVYVRDENPVRAEADFSPFLVQGSRVDCVEAVEADRTGYKKCSWIAVPLTAGGTGELKFRITDAAGNPTYPLIITKEIEVSSIITDGNYWRLKQKSGGQSPITCSPSNINRKLANLKEQNVYCAVELEPLPRLSQAVRDSLRVVDVRIAGIAGCTNTEQSGDAEPSLTRLLETPVIYRKSVGTAIPSLNPVPVVRYVFNKGQYNYDKIFSRCTLQIFSQTSEGVTEDPETETIEVEFGLFELPNAAAALNEKIQKERAELKQDKIGKTVNGFRKLSEYALKICTFIQTYYRILSIMETVVGILDGAQITLEFVPGGQPAAEKLGGFKAFICSTEQDAQEVGAELQGSGAKTGFMSRGLDTSRERLGGIQGKLGKFCSYLKCDTVLWNQNILDSLDEWAGVSHIASASIPQGEKQVDLTRSMNIEDSIISSIMFGCIPGIIKNLDEYRQIKCAYVACLEKDVPFGQDPRVCDRLKNRLYCKYVVGEVFSLLPYYQFLNSFQDQIRQLITNPFALSAGVAGAVCRDTCREEPGGILSMYYPCILWRVVEQSSKIGNAVNDATIAVQSLGSSSIPNDQCKALELDKR